MFNQLSTIQDNKVEGGGDGYIDNHDTYLNFSALVFILFFVSRIRYPLSSTLEN